METKLWKNILRGNKLNEATPSLIKSFRAAVKKMSDDAIGLETDTQLMKKDLPFAIKSSELRGGTKLEVESIDKLKSELDVIRKKSVELNKLILKYYSTVRDIFGEK